MTKKEWEKFEKALARAAAEDVRLTDEELIVILESVPDIDLALDDFEEDEAYMFGFRGRKKSTRIH